MNRFLFSFLLSFISFVTEAQYLESFINDTSMTNAGISALVADAVTGEIIIDFNSEKSLKPASVLKLVTSACALELLGPDYKFSTVMGYTGRITRSGRLTGDIVVRGGGDPVFGSENFQEFYNGFPSGWVDEIKKIGIKKIKGRIITDDSYYDYNPVPAAWLWEDAGNYYGAGVYGASVFDNTYRIHFNTLTGTDPVITGIFPEECSYNLINRLKAFGSSDMGYVYAAPYSTSGWIEGYIPANRHDFVLKASIPDPPLLISRILKKELEKAGIDVAGDATTARQLDLSELQMVAVHSMLSPPLSEILEVLNHESVNLYAEHLVKELGKKYLDTGSFDAGLAVIKLFLDSAGINTNGMYMEDGSGLSPVNSVNSNTLAGTLLYMRSHGKYFDVYLNSLPDPGKEGTFRNCFRDEIFSSCLRAKSGSMTRVRSYAGYLTTLSGRELVFSIIANNFSGPSGTVIPLFEQVLKNLIINL